MSSRSTKTNNLIQLGQRASQWFGRKLQAVRTALPPLLFAAVLIYLWHMTLPLYAKTALLTFAGGGILLLLGQFFQKGVMEPFQEMQKVFGQIEAALLVYADAADAQTSEATQQEARRTLRGLAGDLTAKRRAQGYYGVFADLGMLPLKASIRESVSDLVLMSECIGTDNCSAFLLASERIQAVLWLGL